MGGEFVSLPSGRLEGVLHGRGVLLRCKYTKNRKQNKRIDSFFYAEMEILSKNMIEQVLFAFVLA